MGSWIVGGIERGVPSRVGRKVKNMGVRMSLRGFERV